MLVFCLGLCPIEESAVQGIIHPGNCSLSLNTVCVVLVYNSLFCSSQGNWFVRSRFADEAWSCEKTADVCGGMNRSQLLLLFDDFATEI